MLIDGYIRELQNESEQMLIPTDINEICIDYFYEEWDRFCTKLLSYKNVIISDDGMTLKRDPSKSWGYESVFGEQLIESINNDMIYSWTFKILSRNSYLPIGIATEFKESGDFGDWDNSYFYNTLNGNIRNASHQWHTNYGKQLNSGDTIKMVFNVKKGYLSYIVNGEVIKTKSEFNHSENDGIAFSKIEKAKDLKYRMAVTMYSSNNSITIIDFTKQRAC